MALPGSPTPTTSPVDTDPTEALAAAHTAYVETTTEADQALLFAVARARAAGLSWDAIGAAMGVSRQAVWERFARRIRQHRRGA